MINEKRLLDNFLALTAINSPSKNERQLADFLIAKIHSLSLKVHEDDAGLKIGGNTGNLSCFLPPTSGKFPTLLFCAHLDTVKPTNEIKVQNKNGVLCTSGKTILGADDKAGIAVILEMLAVLQDMQVPHGGLEIVLTVAEETGLEGAKHLDYGKFKSQLGFVLDSGDVVGSYVVQAPTEYDLHITVHGKSAHAGVEPERGVNAIYCTAKTLASLPMGRVDEITTFNIGKISGGETTNIVPELVELWGEVRSLEQSKVEKTVKSIKEGFENFASLMGASAVVQTTKAYQGFDLNNETELQQLLDIAARKSNLTAKPVKRGGGSDANMFNENGIITTNLGLGTKDGHTFAENIAIKDLASAARFACSIVNSLPEINQTKNLHGTANNLINKDG